MSIDSTTEAEFNRLADEWKQHCKENVFHSFDKPYLNCDAYRSLAKMGEEVLPYMRERIHAEIRTFQVHEEMVKGRMREVLGRDDVELMNEPFYKMCEDIGYQWLQSIYDQVLMGSPHHKWGYLLKEIVPDFRLPVGDKDSDAIKSMGGMVGIDVKKTELAIVNWIDDYLAQKNLNPTSNP